MPLYNRPRYRKLACWAQAVLVKALTYEVGSIPDTELMQEGKVLAKEALKQCRRGNLDPWAMILYERTIDPTFSSMRDARKLGYGIRPEELLCYDSEIWEFWLRREALKANRLIEQIESGDNTRREPLKRLCQEYCSKGDDFVSRLKVSRERLEELAGTIR